MLLLVGGEGITPSEAAGVCRITPEAMRQRLARARAALAEELGVAPDEPIVAKRRFGT